jgi:hypothetical protein
MSKIIEAPNGMFLRAQHIVSVSGVFQSPELGCDAWAVYTVGCEEPFQFAAPDQGEGKKAAAARNAETAKLHEAFLFAWGESVEGVSRHQNN